MQIQPLLTSVTTAPPSSATASASAVTVQGSALIVDSVTLSADAQALLNGAASTPDGSAGIWANDTVKRALAALNDTSGKTAVADQISSFRMISSMIADSANFDTDAKRAEASPVTAAFLDSAYAKHLQDVFTNIQSRMQTTQSGRTPESMGHMLGVFNALSSDDQQTFLVANNLYQDSCGESRSQGDAFASADAYRANMMAQIGVARELRTTLADPAYAPKLREELARIPRAGESVSDDYHRKLDTLAAAAEAAGDQRTVDLVSLMSGARENDDWTARAEAHFAAFGPPPATAPSDGPVDWSWPKATAGYTRPSSDALAKALSLINDNSGKTTLVDQAKAFDTLHNYTWNEWDIGPARMAINKNVENSGIYNKLWAAEARYGNAQHAVEAELYDKLDRGDPVSRDEMILRAFNKVSRSDQEFIFAMYGARFEYTDSDPNGKITRYDSLNDYKADLKRRVDESAPVYERITQARNMARAETGNAQVSHEQFTLNWLNKLSIDDQKFFFHTEGNGFTSITRSVNVVPVGIPHHQTLDDYKADLKRKADAEAREQTKQSSTESASSKAKKGKSQAVTTLAGKPGREFASAATLNASIALQVLQAAEASRKSALSGHAWDWIFRSRITAPWGGGRES